MGEEMERKREHPFEKGFSPSPPPVLFPETFIVSDCLLFPRAYERCFLQSRPLFSEIGKEEEMEGKREKPFEKGLFSFPRPPVLFPETFIVSSCFLFPRAHERRFLQSRALFSEIGKEEEMEGKREKPFEKGFSPSSAPLSPFLKLSLLQAVFSFPGHTSEVFFNRVPFFVPDQSK